MKKQNKKQTISKITNTRGYMPPPQRADKPKKGKGSYNRNKNKNKKIFDF